MLYAIAGGGVGNATEITKSLSDLRDKASQDDAEFWVLVEGESFDADQDRRLVWA